MTLKKSIQNLRPYPSLFLLALPVATIEPLKLVAVAVAGKGHWITGTAMIVACYTLSLLCVERLFAIVKPKLMTIPWFARIWIAFASIRTSALDWLTCGGSGRQERESGGTAGEVRRP